MLVLRTILFVAMTVCLGFAGKPFLVAIDPGHNKKSFGAVSARGITEYSYNIKMAKVLLKTIEESNSIQAFIINPDGRSISLKDRTIKAKEKSANLYLSLHHDSVQNEYINYWRYKNGKNHYSDDFSGYSIFVSYKNHDVNQSLIFAKYLGEELFSSGFTPTLHHAEKIKGENRKLLDKKLGIYQFDDLVVLKTAQMPAVLLECGIIVNRKEELLLNSDTFREEFSRGIVNAIKKYKNSFKGKK